MPSSNGGSAESKLETFYICSQFLRREKKEGKRRNYEDAHGQVCTEHRATAAYNFCIITIHTYIVQKIRQRKKQDGIFKTRLLKSSTRRSKMQGDKEEPDASAREGEKVKKNEKCAGMHVNVINDNALNVNKT